jgi:hypothetical protein
VTSPCRSHRSVPNRAIRSAEDARRTLMLATNNGRDRCVIVACVDGDRLPLTMFVFDGNPNLDDDLEEAVEMVMTASTRVHTSLGALFLGSSRPGGEPGPSVADEQRWVRMADRCADLAQAGEVDQTNCSSHSSEQIPVNRPYR